MFLHEAKRLALALLHSHIFEARIDIRALDVRIGPEKPLNRIAVCQHADYLMHGNTRALNTSLPVANGWVN
jgi:hypothetical protein